jgi:hypothetical protein
VGKASGAVAEWQRSKKDIVAAQVGYRFRPGVIWATDIRQD